MVSSNGVELIKISSGFSVLAYNLPQQVCPIDLHNKLRSKMYV